MARKKTTPPLELRKVTQRQIPGAIEAVELHTSAGIIYCYFHAAQECEAAVVWVGGAGGGLEGPAGGMYARLAARLLHDRIASLRLDYRQANQLTDCILDTLLGVAYLQYRNYSRIALVGHSFGGAVVISAGVASGAVAGVAALSSQTIGTDTAPALSPRPLLLMHGTVDPVLPDLCSRDIFRRAGEPKQMLLYPGCGHGLDECREQVDQDLLHWLRQVLQET